MWLAAAIFNIDLQPSARSVNRGITSGVTKGQWEAARIHPLQAAS